MSIKGIKKELYVGKTGINIITSAGKRTSLSYGEIKSINYCFANSHQNGFINFITKNNTAEDFKFSAASNDPIKKTIAFINEHAPEVNTVEQLYTDLPAKNKNNIFYTVKEIWLRLSKPSKIIFILWSIYSLSALSQINIFQWFICWIAGSIILIGILQLIVFSKTKREQANHKKILAYYKKNFYNLDDIENGFYKNSLHLDLEMVKLLSETVNNTKDIRVFTNSLNQILKILSTLSEHEYTGYFQNKQPSQILDDIKKNRFLSEISFIQRSFPLDVNERNVLDNFQTIYLLKHFTPEAIEYFRTGKCVSYEEILAKENDIEFKNNINFDYMDGHDFEYFCADLLKKNGYINVEVTKGSGDQGIDIIAYKDGAKYGIQCKCYSQDIGNKAIQEAYAGAKFYDCHVPVVLTNRYFTPSAKELANKTNVLLWDRDKLNNMICSAEPF